MEHLLVSDLASMRLAEFMNAFIGPVCFLSAVMTVSLLVTTKGLVWLADLALNLARACITSRMSASRRQTADDDAG
ncbi:hypothetical protein AB870_09330 [Pandoraea faecigallinarum]|uniref:Uncharacterized protein n=1 Tax=Pandoraea faecigallinarum TaxID=656179 RepID=A0A0H3WUI0_9BURK|nr:hypothetical protein AB870_09330 [Pandoraea faecigallinarum]